MRVLKLFFTATVMLTIFTVIVGLVAREILLMMGVSQVRAAARQLSSLQIESNFAQQCQDFGSLPQGTISLTRVQLRFTSPTTYVLEVVCQTSESLRTSVGAESLPPLVEKGVGQSGIVRGEDLHGVTLSVLGRTGVVYEEDSFVRTALTYTPAINIITDNGPATVCEGYGFQCCNNTTQLGQGTQQTQALDCPLSCYATCVNRPVVLNFESDPTHTAGTRVVTIQAGEPVQFFYTLNDIRGDVFASSVTAEEKQRLSFVERTMRSLQNLFKNTMAPDSLKKILISFGDGESIEVSDLQGAVSHTYTCLQAVCVYNAAIQAITQAGTASVLTAESKLELHVVSE